MLHHCSYARHGALRLWIVRGAGVFRVVVSPLLRDESVDPVTAVLPCSNRGRVAESGAVLAEYAAPTRHSSMVII